MKVEQNEGYQKDLITVDHFFPFSPWDAGTTRNFYFPLPIKINQID